MTFKSFLIWVGGVFALIALRYMLTGTVFYLFIIWNMILAAAPLWVGSLMHVVRQKEKGTARAIRVILAGAWLVLLPNAFYILTDFTHQNNDVVVNMRNDGYHGGINYIRGDALYVFDSFLIFVATIFGTYCGGLALLHAYIFLKKHTSKGAAYAAIGGIMVLSGIGVYIGRYGRWNSWDVLYRPFHILTDFLYQFLSSVSRERMFVTILTMVLFQGFALYGVYWIHKQRMLKRK